MHIYILTSIIMYIYIDINTGVHAPVCCAYDNSIIVNICWNDIQWRAEAIGCPGPTRFLDALEIILYSSRKISDDLFLVVHLNFSLFSHQLSNFTRIRSFYAPSTASRHYFTSFLVIYLHFLKKTGPVDAPQGGCPEPSHRPHPPLHTTDDILRIIKWGCFYVYLIKWVNGCFVVNYHCYNYTSRTNLSSYRNSCLLWVTNI